MLQRAQGSLTFLRPQSLRTRQTDGAARCLFQWAVIDPGDKIIDLCCGNGALLNSISQKFDCELCGIAHTLEESREARQLLPDSDIIFALPEDIPWHNGSFDLALCGCPLAQLDHPQEALNEIMRVLKPGGGLLLAAPWYPAPIRQLVNCFKTYNGASTSLYMSKDDTLDALTKAGFDNLRWNVDHLGMAVVSAWKPRELNDA